MTKNNSIIKFVKGVDIRSQSRIMASMTVTGDDQQGICQYSSYMMDLAQFNNDLTIISVQSN